MVASQKALSVGKTLQSEKHCTSKESLFEPPFRRTPWAQGYSFFLSDTSLYICLMCVGSCFTGSLKTAKVPQGHKEQESPLGQPSVNPVESLQNAAEPLQETPAETSKNPLRSKFLRESLREGCAPRMVTRLTTLLS